MIPAIYCRMCKQHFENEGKPDRCPVCGANGDALVHVDEETSPPYRDSDMRYVIIGTGVAGLNCAKAIRQRDHTASIKLIGAEEQYPYNRPGLSALIAGKVKMPMLMLEKSDYYQTHQLEIITGTKVLGIDADSKTLSLSNGAALPYDKLCIASGADAFNPYPQTEDSLPVYCLRSYEDAQKVITTLQGKNVFIVGAGILGLEAVMALKKQGCTVSVADVCATPLCLQADAHAGAILKADLENAGVHVYMCNTVQTRVKDGVILKDGTKVACDALLVSIGVRSSTALAKAVGLEVNRGILVNAYGETSKDDIYACGDCAEFEGCSGGLWQIAILQGKATGAAMTGDRSAPYVPDVPALMFRGPSVNVMSLGTVTGELDTLCRKSADNKDYRMLAFRDGKLCGALFINAAVKSAAVLELIRSGIGMQEAMALLQ